jgi:hypothetical protein
MDLRRRLLGSRYLSGARLDNRKSSLATMASRPVRAARSYASVVRGDAAVPDGRSTMNDPPAPVEADESSGRGPVENLDARLARDGGDPPQRDGASRAAANRGGAGARGSGRGRGRGRASGGGGRGAAPAPAPARARADNNDGNVAPVPAAAPAPADDEPAVGLPVDPEDTPVETSPLKPPRSGRIGDAAYLVMEEQCELYGVTDLLPALEAAGLADPLMFLGCSPPNRVDGMRGVATSMSHDDALRYAASKILKSGVGGLPRLRQLVVRLRPLSRHLAKNESELMRDIQTRLTRVVPTSAQPPDSAPLGRPNAREEGAATVDRLQGIVCEQRQGHPIRSDEVSSSADVLAAYDALTRTPARSAPLNSLELRTRWESSCDDGTRHAKNKDHKHERGKSAFCEGEYFTRWCCSHAEGGAVAAPDGVIANEIDRGSGVQLGEEGDGDGETILMSRYQSVRECCAQLLACSNLYALNRHEMSSYVNLIVAYVDEELRSPRASSSGERGLPTFTEALSSAARSRVRLAEDARAEAGRRSSSSRSSRPAARSTRASSPRRSPRRRSPSSSSSSGSPVRRRTARKRSPSPDRRRAGSRKDTGRDRRTGDRDAKRPKAARTKAKDDKDDAPVGLCFAWAKHQITKDRDDKCSKSSGACRWAHEFRKDSERRWAKRRYG